MSIASKSKRCRFHSRLAGVFWLVLVLLATMGLVTPFARQMNQSSSERHQAGDAKLPEGFLPVPVLQQSTKYGCGPAALTSVLQYWQVYQDQESLLHPQLGTTSEFGTAPESIVEVAKSFGLIANQSQEGDFADLRSALGRGETVILNFQAWRTTQEGQPPWKEEWDCGHYAVLIAMDADYAFFMDPWVGGYGYLPLSELADRWHDFTDLSGKRKEYRHLAIRIRGETPHGDGPSLPLVRIK
jgi:predicted double-glycine peptidase